MYSIYYMKPSWFREGILGATPDPKNLEATHVHLKDLKAEHPAERISTLTEVWIAMQAEFWSPHGEARPLIKEKGLKHTSMSVGDVIVEKGIAYVVAAVGFKRLGEVSNA